MDRLQQLARSIRKNAPWESIAELEEGWRFREVRENLRVKEVWTGRHQSSFKVLLP